jgi:hypothetical protein
MARAFIQVSPNQLAVPVPTDTLARAGVEELTVRAVVSVRAVTGVATVAKVPTLSAISAGL